MIKEVGTELYPIGLGGLYLVKRLGTRDKPDEIRSVVFARAVELMPNFSAVSDASKLSDTSSIRIILVPVREKVAALALSNFHNKRSE